MGWWEENMEAQKSQEKRSSLSRQLTCTLLGKCGCAEEEGLGERETGTSTKNQAELISGRSDDDPNLRGNFYILYNFL